MAKGSRARQVITAVAIAGVLSSCGPSSSGVGSRTAPAPTPLTLRPCRVSGVEGKARCGTHEVYENRDERKGRVIGLNVVVLPARNGRSLDPVFVLQGGPGQAATSLADFYARTFAALRDERDVVLVDQRGTGESNPLNCALGGSARDPQGYLGDLFPVDAIRACRAELERRADLRLYTTPIAMEDLDEVRAALGYERINLYGTSYGTRAALVYLRAHPARVRSMVLKGVVPMSAVIPQDFAEDSQRAMDLLLDDCAADAACARAFPNFRQDFAAALARLDTGAAAAAVRDSASGRPARLLVSRELFTSMLRSALQSTTTSAELPFIVHRAGAGDFAPFAELALTYRRAGAALSAGMFLSVVCAEDVPFIDADVAARGAARSFLGDYWVRQVTRACAQWPRGTLPAGYRKPVVSDVPALLISGFLDPATPPRGGEEAARTLRNSRHVVVRSGSHSFAGLSGCVDRIIADFVRAASASSLDVACVERVERPRFATALSSRAP